MLGIGGIMESVESENHWGPLLGVEIMALRAKIIMVLRTKIIVSTDSGDSLDSTDSGDSGDSLDSSDSGDSNDSGLLWDSFVFFCCGSKSKISFAVMCRAKIIPSC